MQQNGVYEKLKMLEIALEEGFPIIPRKYTIVKTLEMETLIDRIYKTLPVEVQEARALLSNKEKIQLEAQQCAEKIVKEAQEEADRKLSEADYLKALEREANRIRAQVQEECEDIKRHAAEEAENLRRQAREDATRTREGMELYCQQVLTNLENNVTSQLQEIKKGQVYMEQMRADAVNAYDKNQYQNVN